MYLRGMPQELQRERGQARERERIHMPGLRRAGAGENTAPGAPADLRWAGLCHGDRRM